MKVYFTAEEMHTPEYSAYVKWVSEVWRLNDERNKLAQSEEKHLQDLDCIAEIESGIYSEE